MKFFIVFLTVSVAFIFNACSSKAPLSPASNTEPGSASVTVKMGTIGSLAKRANIEFAKLCVSLSASGETTVLDTLSLSGNSSTTVSKTYGPLASLKTWTLNVLSLDTRDSLIHSGSTTFDVRPKQTSNVNLDLNARFSMLKANFFPIRDSVTRCELLVDGTLKASESFPIQSRLGDTVKLGFDYLQTNLLQRIKMDVYGSMWGFDTLLYTADTAINPQPGVNSNYNLTLKWVGPALPPPGQATMTVVLGALGTVSINGELQNNGDTNITVTDIDGNVYHTVKIGTQTWTVENLKTTRYNDGTPIPLVTDATAWAALTTPGYCWYDNNEVAYKNKYGALYNWYGVNTGKLAPAGWHVPTNAEWLLLIKYLGYANAAGGKLKEAGITHWITPNNGATNECGFTALPGGERWGVGGMFDGVDWFGCWWNTTEGDASNAYCYDLTSNYSNVGYAWNPKSTGNSVRLVKD